MLLFAIFVVICRQWRRGEKWKLKSTDSFLHLYDEQTFVKFQESVANFSKHFEHFSTTFWHVNVWMAFQIALPMVLQVFHTQLFNDHWFSIHFTPIKYFCLFPFILVVNINTTEGWILNTVLVYDWRKGEGEEGTIKFGSKISMAQ